MSNFFTEGNALLVKTTVSIIFATLFEKIGISGYLFITLIFFMILDYISAILAAKQEKLRNPEDETLGWNSSKGKEGTINKLKQMIAVVACMVLDKVIGLVGPELGITILESFKFTFVILVYYNGAELISIIENLNKGTDKVIPDWLVSTVKWLDTSFGQFVAHKLSDLTKDKIDED